MPTCPDGSYHRKDYILRAKIKDHKTAMFVPKFLSFFLALKKQSDTATTLQPIFHLCIPTKDLAKFSILISTIFFQNRIIMFCLDYAFTVVQEIHISRLELQRWSLDFFISFPTVYV
jgi:hypothetical protein